MKELNIICTNALNILCEDVNAWAAAKGWNETPDSLSHRAEQIALMHSELSECLEFVRKKPTCICHKCGPDLQAHPTVTKCCCGEIVAWQPAMDDHVPALTGESAELADVLIRIFHYCGRRGINLGEAVRLKHEYNITRPYRHGKNF